jgi:hypothetical protein
MAIPGLRGIGQLLASGGVSRAAAILSDFGFKAKAGAPSPSGRSSSACSHPSWGGGRAKGQEGAGARVSGSSGGDGVGHDRVWLGWETTAE